LDFGGDYLRGAQLIAVFGCGSCHSILGIREARGRVGPPLDNIGERTIIAGLLPNTPDNLMTWLKAPQSVVAGNAMPNMDLNDHDVRDVAAYLYTLR
jgi:cytochrome c